MSLFGIAKWCMLCRDECVSEKGTKRTTEIFFPQLHPHLSQLDLCPLGELGDKLSSVGGLIDIKSTIVHVRINLLDEGFKQQEDGRLKARWTFFLLVLHVGSTTKGLGDPWKVVV